MDHSESLSEKAWAAIWRRAGKELEAIRWREVKRADTEQAIASLGDAFESAVLHQPPLPSSGMTEMQRFFRRVAHGAVDRDSR